MEEHQLLIRVCVHIFHLKFTIELFADLDGGFCGFGEDGREGEYGDGLVFGVQGCALLGEPFGRDEVRVGEGGRPGGEEDVVLEVRGGDVGDFAAEGGECALDGGCEGDWLQQPGGVSIASSGNIFELRHGFMCCLLLLEYSIERQFEKLAL